jgi:hypothetical protein
MHECHHRSDERYAAVSIAHDKVKGVCKAGFFFFDTKGASSDSLRFLVKWKGIRDAYGCNDINVNTLDQSQLLVLDIVLFMSLRTLWILLAAGRDSVDDELCIPTVR